MSFINKLELNQESGTFIRAVVFIFIAVFIVSSASFMWLISDKLDVVMSQKAGITYTYFLYIMDRIIAFVTIFLILPLSIYQLISKNKNRFDKIISVLAVLILGFLAGIFWGGEYRFFNSYQNGELSYSKLFCNHSPEMDIFDKILRDNGTEIPQMCIEK